MTRLRTERLVAGGDALARLDDGRIAFVRGAAPEETIDAEVVEDRGDFVRASLVAVVEPSTARVEPSCPHRRAGCGGCGWMHLDPSAQFDAKVEIVAESLRRIGRMEQSLVDELVRPVGAVASTGVRTTIRLAGVADEEGVAGVGFREESSDRVVPIGDCEVAHPTLSALIADLEVAVGVELTLRTSVATGAVTAFWSSPRQGRRGRRRGATPRPALSTGRMVEGLPRSVHVGERAHLTETVAGVELRVSAPSFFQSSPCGAELLVAAVESAAPELVGARHVVDAYGGVGLFAATAMRRARHVTLIESARSSADDARHNLGGRGDDATIVRADVGRWEPDGAHAPPIGAPGPGPVEVVVADPARTGLGRAGVSALVATEAPTFVLVSCDPVSLARDARLLGDVGYRPERVEVLDLFPQTPHVETVTRFTRRSATSGPGTSSTEG